MPLDTEFLARLQFALTASFHYLYPPFTIGLGWLMVIMEGRYLRTGDPVYEQMAKFWTKLFAATFAMGVTTGIVLEFEFGTNWAAYSRFVGDVFGSPLAAEAIFSFFLESVFLGVLVFGWDRVSAKMHFFSTAMVALGATLSSLWIVVANSWQHTPAGFKIVGEGKDAHAEITSFWAMFFNPSSMGREAHVVLAAMVTACFVVMSVSAWYILRKRHEDFARRGFRIGLVTGLLSSILLAGAGHYQGRLLAKTQPAKLAAFEAHFKTGEGPTPLYVIGLPDVRQERVRFGIYIPYGLSILAFNSFTKPVDGLDKFPREDWPPVMLPFFGFHLMVGLGVTMIDLTVLGVFFWWRRKLFEQRGLLWLFVLAAPIPYIANELGWIATEVGRQPWIVQGLLRTKDALSESVSASQVLGSTVMFTGLYTLLFLLYLFIISKKIIEGPEPVGEGAGEEK